MPFGKYIHGFIASDIVAGVAYSPVISRVEQKSTHISRD